MRKTKIVCTIGPASEQMDVLKQLMEAGMNVARLNFSHGNHEEHGARIKTIRQAAKDLNKFIAILLDTKGPEIRTHQMQNDAIDLVAGKEIKISMNEVLGTPEMFSITYPQLVDDVRVGSKIMLDDGNISLEVIQIDSSKKEIHTKILNSGVLKNKKGVNVPGISVQLPGITDKDKLDIEFGIQQGIDYIAASFVRRASDVLEIRRILEKNSATHISIIAKIENQEGVDNIDEILEVSDGLMVARGDLGVEIPSEEVPLVQKMLIQKCNRLGKPVITATQMLDSMQRNPRPTRAEASDVANAIFDGTDAVMLSGETASGLYPVQAVETMKKIAIRTEQSLDYQAILSERTKHTKHLIPEAIGQSVAHVSLNLGAHAIITPTESGHTAKMISKYRPKAPIIAVTYNEGVSRRLSLIWGVYPQLGERASTTDDMLELAVAQSVQSGMIQQGNLVVITAGVPIGEAGTTNLMKVHVVGNILIKGQGIGRNSVFGKVVIAKDSQQLSKMKLEHAVLVTTSTNKDMITYVEKCAAVITEKARLTSHAAIAGLSIGIPVIVGAKGATTILQEGQEVTVDAVRGFVYEGHASVL